MIVNIVDSLHDFLSANDLGPDLVKQQARNGAAQDVLRSDLPIRFASLIFRCPCRRVDLPPLLVVSRATYSRSLLTQGAVRQVEDVAVDLGIPVIGGGAVGQSGRRWC